MNIQDLTSVFCRFCPLFFLTRRGELILNCVAFYLQELTEHKKVGRQLLERLQVGFFNMYLMVFCRDIGVYVARTLKPPAQCAQAA
jgi:hypothetical protein